MTLTASISSYVEQSVKATAEQSVYQESVKLGKTPVIYTSHIPLLITSDSNVRPFIIAERSFLSSGSCESALSTASARLIELLCSITRSHAVSSPVSTDS